MNTSCSHAVHPESLVESTASLAFPGTTLWRTPRPGPPEHFFGRAARSAERPTPNTRSSTGPWRGEKANAARDVTADSGYPLTAMIQKIEAEELNVLGGPLQVCCRSPRTGFYRDGTCRTGPDDAGRHVVCVKVTDEFLAYSRSRGNDLSTPMPKYGFPGLVAGDCWCLCALRWVEALRDGFAPAVKLGATHRSALQVISLEDLQSHALTE